MAWYEGVFITEEEVQTLKKMESVFLSVFSLGQKVIICFKEENSKVLHKLNGIISGFHYQVSDVRDVRDVGVLTISYDIAIKTEIEGIYSVIFDFKGKLYLNEEEAEKDNGEEEKTKSDEATVKEIKPSHLKLVTSKDN